MKLKRHSQILIFNVGILGGIAIVYLRGSPIASIVISGIFLLMLVNVIFFVLARWARKTQ
jgi:hypothetical protein